MPSLINATSTDVNPGLNELLGSVAFNTEHSINECRPLRFVARILQAVLLRNLAIGFAIVALDKRGNVAFEINGLVAGLDDTLANARGTEDIGVEDVVIYERLSEKARRFARRRSISPVSVLKYS